MLSNKLEYPIAILSDVNGNLEALEAVLADIKTQNIKSILFLSDAIGFGPNPAECLDLLRDTVNVYLLGQLEVFMLEQIYKNSPSPLRDKNLLAWPAKMLKKVPDPRRWRPRRIEWLASQPDIYKFDSFCATYAPRELLGAPICPGRRIEGLTLKLESYFKAHRILILSGVKIPWYFRMDDSNYTEVNESRAIGIDAIAPVIVSAGSVGQPHDLNPKACYVIVTETKIFWRRVEYDVEKTVAKIKAIPILRPINASRLLKGI